MKYVGVSLSKPVLYTENYKVLVKLQNDLNKWRDILSS